MFGLYAIRESPHVVAQERDERELPNPMAPSLSLAQLRRDSPQVLRKAPQPLPPGDARPAPPGETPSARSRSVSLTPFAPTWKTWAGSLGVGHSFQEVLPVVVGVGRVLATSPRTFRVSPARLARLFCLAAPAPRYLPWKSIQIPKPTSQAATLCRAYPPM